MKILSSLIIGILLFPQQALAQSPSPEACYAQVVEDLVRVHDEYRSYVFGSREDDDGDFAVLTGGFASAEREGIFEVKRRLGSELVEPLVEAYRVYRCRSLAVCTLLSDSITKQSTEPIDVKVLGCAAIEGVPRYDMCYFAGGAATPVGQEDSQGQYEPLRLVDQCNTLVEQTLAAERSVLRLAVGYDAGYRSLLQLAGMMDWMLDGFPTQAVKAVSDMVNMLGKLHQIPCFIGQCDNPDSDFLTP